MRHQPWYPQLLPSQQPWKQMKWSVTLMVDERGNIASASATAHRTQENGNPLAGFSSMRVEPFCDLRSVLNELLIESALDLETPQGGYAEVPLPFDPFTV